MKKKRFSLLRFFVVIISVTAVFILACNIWLVSRTNDRVFDSIDQIPSNRIGLLIDCDIPADEYTSPLPDGRVQAAADLYHAGKIQCVVVSTNRQLFNDGPLLMKQALIDRDIPGAAVILDSCRGGMEDNLSHVCRSFGETSLTVISDRFHTYRPVFVGRYTGLNIIAYCSQDMPWMYALKSNGRELLERVTSVMGIYLFQPVVLTNTTVR